MKNKLIATAAATLLASTVFAAAQMDGAPGNDRDRTGATTDSSQNSANPEHGGPRPGMRSGTVGGPAVSGPMGDPANPPTTDSTPLQPGGISPSAPPQGQSSGGSAYPRPR